MWNRIKIILIVYIYLFYIMYYVVLVSSMHVCMYVMCTPMYLDYEGTCFFVVYILHY